MVLFIYSAHRRGKDFNLGEGGKLHVCTKINQPMEKSIDQLKLDINTLHTHMRSQTAKSKHEFPIVYEQ